MRKLITPGICSCLLATSALAQAGPFTDRMLAITKDYTFFGPQFNGPWTTIGINKNREANCLLMTSWTDGSAVVFRVDMTPTETDEPPRLFIASPQFAFANSIVDKPISLTAQFYDTKDALIAQGNFPNATIDSNNSIITKPVNVAFMKRFMSSSKMVLVIDKLPPIEISLAFSGTATQSLLRCIDDYDTLHKSK